MFNLFSRKKEQKVLFDFAALRVDMHSHLLPGIDDGAEDIDTAVALIKGMSGLGYKKIITTPHILWDMYKNTPAIIQEKLVLVRGAIAEQNIPVQLEAAAEYFLDEHVEELLAKKERLLTFGDNKVLTEFSMMYPPLNAKAILFEMQMQGYQPVIAHPERYIYLQNNTDFYTELRDIDCLFQLNILALSGYYGRSVTELAKYLLKNEYYTLIGTDLHHVRHIEALQRIEMTTDLQNLLDSGKLLNSSL